MKTYRIKKRAKGNYYLVNRENPDDRKSLGTPDKKEAEKLLAVWNQKEQGTTLNLELGRAYLKAANPQLANRKWQEAMDELSKNGKETTQTRYKRSFQAKPFDNIRNKPIAETSADDLRDVLKQGGNTVSHNLRCLHNFAVGNGWTTNGAILPPKQWQKPDKSDARGITFEEYSKILESEQNEERRNYYKMLWLTGAAQTDGSLLSGKNIDWQEKTIFYNRMKTGEFCQLSLSKDLEELLKELPKQGYFFPTLAAATVKDKDKAANQRAAEFCRRRKVAGVSGVSLHSFRYAWVQRAQSAGYPERYAQAAIGHSSKAVHRAYAKGGKVVCPPMESNGADVIPFTTVIAQLENAKIA